MGPKIEAIRSDKYARNWRVSNGDREGVYALRHGHAFDASDIIWVGLINWVSERG